MYNKTACFLLLLCIFSAVQLHAQLNPMRGGLPGGVGRGRMGGGMTSGSKDSIAFEKRKFSDDSATVRFRYLDSARYRSLDSSISDFYDKIPLDPDHITLGNNGTATRSILFNPQRRVGWNPGFHAYDAYQYRIEDTRFMSTDKPFTQLTYLLGSRSEQHIGVVHTQNIKPDWNAGLEYRLITSPGFFSAQNTNHKNFRFHTHYTSKNRRYTAFLVGINNANQSAENGGITNDTFLLNKNPAYNDLFNIPTNLAQLASQTRNFFSIKLNTGNRYTNNTFLLRQQYDFGKKDSTVTDSTVIRFFLPKFRLEHTLGYHQATFRYVDQLAALDKSFYQTNYGLTAVGDTVDFTDQWRELSNDFSIIQFPDAANPLQFLKIGATLLNYRYSNITGNTRDVFSNLKLHGEYRNRTKNRKWDMLLYGEFFSLGRHLGNYDLQANLKSNLGARLGFLEIGGRNVNRSPTYLMERLTAFPAKFRSNLKNENILQLYGSIIQPSLRLKLTADYFLISNYVYFTDFDQINQSAPIFSFLRLGLNRQFRISRTWKWYLDAYFQQATGKAPVNVPLIFTRNRLAYEGKLFRNLELSTGLDLRYHTPYSSPGYSPVLGQFYFQDQFTAIIRPDIAAYTNFRIRTFNGYVRLENLNTLTFINGFGFKNINQPTESYPYPGLLLRLGVVWTMIN